jgi:hypothetical protein
MDKWEYKSLLCDGPSMDTTLATLGEEGWEAVGFAPVVHRDAERSMDYLSIVREWLTAEYRVLLKRRKP